jgi:RimJ/RimL family protein N-acetyltransferase
MSYVLAQDADGGPVLVTARLRLRMPRLADADTAWPFWSSARSVLMGGPWSRDQLQAETQGLLDQWRKHGFSLFTVTRGDTDEGIGGIGPFFPDTHPEPELGWSLWNAADEGHGIAFEAASAARDWFFATSGCHTAVSYTDPDNTRSHRLCERLGAVIDPDAAHPFGGEPTLTWRHSAGAAA